MNLVDSARDPPEGVLSACPAHLLGRMLNPFPLPDPFFVCVPLGPVRDGEQPKTIVDLGCSTGLSTLKLHQSFPEAEVLGMDLSPYMLAVAKYNLKHRKELSEVRSRETEGEGAKSGSTRVTGAFSKAT